MGRGFPKRSGKRCCGAGILLKKRARDWASPLFRGLPKHTGGLYRLLKAGREARGLSFGAPSRRAGRRTLVFRHRAAPPSLEDPPDASTTRPCSCREGLSRTGSLRKSGVEAAVLPDDRRPWGTVLPLARRCRKCVPLVRPARQAAHVNPGPLLLAGPWGGLAHGGDRLAERIEQPKGALSTRRRRPASNRFLSAAQLRSRRCSFRWSFSLRPER